MHLFNSDCESSNVLAFHLFPELQGGWKRVEDIYALRVEENELVYYLFYDFGFFLNANYLSNIAMVSQLITR